jgi:hypothetical protein
MCTHIDIQIHSFIHERVKKIFDPNILNRKIFSSKNYFTIKIVQINIHAHINTDKLMHKDTFYRHIQTHTRVDQRILMYVI